MLFNPKSSFPLEIGHYFGIPLKHKYPPKKPKIKDHFKEDSCIPFKSL